MTIHCIYTIISNLAYDHIYILNRQLDTPSFFFLLSMCFLEKNTLSALGCLGTLQRSQRMMDHLSTSQLVTTGSRAPRGGNHQVISLGGIPGPQIQWSSWRFVYSGPGPSKWTDWNFSLAFSGWGIPPVDPHFRLRPGWTTLQETITYPIDPYIRHFWVDDFLLFLFGGICNPFPGGHTCIIKLVFFEPLQLKDIWDICFFLFDVALRISPWLQFWRLQKWLTMCQKAWKATVVNGSKS